MVVKIILIVLEVLASIALIGAVLMQSGKEAGLSGAIAGNADTYMDRIHTKRDTVFQQENIAYLTEKTLQLIANIN